MVSVCRVDSTAFGSEPRMPYTRDHLPAAALPEARPVSHDHPQQDEPIINLRGEKVALGPLDPSMAPVLTKWINDFSTVRTLGADPKPTTESQEIAWIERV